MSKQVSSVVVAGLQTVSKYVDQFVVECYSDVGLTTMVNVAATGAVWNSSISRNQQKSLLIFKGLTLGTTYYFRAGVSSPITGTTVWSAAFSVVAGSTTGPSGVTYTGSYIATTSGISYTLTPASVPTDIDHYEIAYTLDGSVPGSTVLPSQRLNASSTLNFFIGGKIGDRVTAYIRAANTNQQLQIWTLLGTISIQNAIQDAIVHQGTSPGGVGVDNYSYRQFSTATYTIVSGDRLEYDIYIDPKSPEFKAGVDFNYLTPSQNFRGAGINDQNGVGCLQSTDLTNYAKGKVYHREFDLSSLAGKAIQSWATFLEGDTAGNYKAQISNIKIMNGSTLQLAVFTTGAISKPPIWANGVSTGETYTSVVVHTAQTSAGSIDTAQLVNNSVTGDIAYVSATARDVNLNLFGSPLMNTTTGTALTAASISTLESWTYRQDGTSPTDTPEFRNGAEIRVCMVTATSGTYVSVGQTKDYKRFFTGAYYSLRCSVRKLSTDPTPNGNFNMVMRAYDGSNNLVSTTVVATTAASGITSTSSVIYGNFIWNLVPGAQYYYFGFENTSTNCDLYITQAMLNRGPAISEYTEQTYLSDVAQYTTEGYGFVSDGFTGSNGTTLQNHYPDTAGFEWVKNSTTGTGDLQIQTNAATVQSTAVTNNLWYNNKRPALAPAYYVQADVAVGGTTTSDWAGVMGRFTSVSNYYYAYLRGDGALILGKVVANTNTVLQTVASVGTSGTLQLVLTVGNQKVYVNGTLKASATDTALTYGSTEMVGMYLSNAATANHSSVDNFSAVYVQNVATPGTPPPGGGGGGAPGEGGSGGGGGGLLR